MDHVYKSITILRIWFHVYMSKFKGIKNSDNLLITKPEPVRLHEWILILDLLNGMRKHDENRTHTILTLKTSPEQRFCAMADRCQDLNRYVWIQSPVVKWLALQDYPEFVVYSNRHFRLSVTHVNTTFANVPKCQARFMMKNLDLSQNLQSDDLFILQHINWKYGD